jgi:hypothetical protein
MLEVSFRWINGVQLWFLSGSGQVARTSIPPRAVLEEAVRSLEKAISASERRGIVSGHGDQTVLGTFTPVG